MTDKERKRESILEGLGSMRWGSIAFNVPTRGGSYSISKRSTGYKVYWHDTVKFRKVKLGEFSTLEGMTEYLNKILGL